MARPSKAASRAKPPVADVAVELAETGRVPIFQAKTANVVKQFGGPTKVARVLKVSKSQPGRWVRGDEAPSPTSAKHLLDLDYALSRLEQLYEPETAQAWLSSPNAYLNGARPLDVLLAEGPADVIEAIDASVAGSYA
jgi:hypothetical protein